MARNLNVPKKSVLSFLSMTPVTLPPVVAKLWDRLCERGTKFCTVICQIGTLGGRVGVGNSPF